MTRFVISFVVLIFVVSIIIIDAGRIFYLPLLKIHPSHHESKSILNIQVPVKHTHEEASISDEYIPLSVMERNMFEEQDEIEKRETFRGETSANQRELDYLKSLDHGTRMSHNVQKDAIDYKYPQNSNEPWSVDTASGQLARLQSDVDLDSSERAQRRNDTLFLLIVGICSLVGILGLVAAAIFWYRIQKRAEAAIDSDYSSYGVTGPGNTGGKISANSTISDRKLAQSAQMFHYQQQRQQMMAQEKAHLDAKPVHSDDSDDETPTNGDYTVYECPGLAPTGEMEVRNPLFTEPESSTPTSNPTTNNHYPQLSNTLPSSSSTQDKSSS